MDVIKYSNVGFVILESAIVPQARTVDVKNALYVALYNEFLGASKNPKYQDLTVLERVQKLNDYAKDWLKQKGIYNESNS